MIVRYSGFLKSSRYLKSISCWEISSRKQVPLNSCLMTGTRQIRVLHFAPYRETPLRPRRLGARRDARLLEGPGIQ